MAIDDLLDEHEQEQRVRAWLRRNGLSIFGGVVVGLAAIYGWQTWQASRLAGSAADYMRYQSVVSDIASSDLDRAATQLAELEADSKGIYPELAALALAKAQVDAGKPEDALVSLRNIQADGAFKLLVNQRIARLLIETGKPADAVKVLGDADDVLSLEVRADALLADAQVAPAAQLYAQALQATAADAPQRRLLEIKLSDAGGTPLDVSESTK